MKTSRGKKLPPKTSRRRVIKKPSLMQRSLRFLPALLILSAAYILNTTPTSGTSRGLRSNSVLSFATSMNNTDLLAYTNSQRAENGQSALTINAQLNAAAQSKANDMVARDYWAHVTPTGEQPWAFMASAGYTYRTAGENLAYGFDNASDTVTGWMNSPPHRENLLNSSFQDVGFGFANSSNFVGNGEQTIIVAMYGAQVGQPAAAVAVAEKPQTKPSAIASEPEPVAEPVAEPAPAPVEAAPTETKTEIPAAQTTTTTQPTKAAPVTAPVQVRRIQVITGGDARWSSTLLVLSLCAMGILWSLRRGSEIKRLMRAGEHFFIHNLHIDMTVMAFLVLGATLLQTTGTIR